MAIVKSKFELYLLSIFNIWDPVCDKNFWEATMEVPDICTLCDLHLFIQRIINFDNDHSRRFGVEVIDMKNIGTAKRLSFQGPVYISLDMHCLDPAFSPGASHHEPGEKSTREVLDILQNLPGDIVGADIVEYNPQRD